MRFFGGTSLTTLGLVSGSLLTLSVLTGPAVLAVGEVPAPDTFVTEITSYFYYLDAQKVSTPVGTPYITPISNSQVLGLDWDFELSVTNIDSGASTFLGTLPLPAQNRVLDIYWDATLPKNSISVTALISYGEFGADQCRRSVLREVTVDLTGAEANKLGKYWFRSPCFPAAEQHPLKQSGGRVTAIPAKMQKQTNGGRYFFSVGDFALSRAQMAKLPTASRKYLTSVVQLNAPGESEIWATGLRNVQGITTGMIDGTPELVTTEHGPRGGDDLNIVRKGNFYGWPAYSYGTPYGPVQPQNTATNQGMEKKSTQPVFSWLPSIGPTSIVQVKGPAFNAWWNKAAQSPDFIVNGMGSHWLHRLRIENGAVRYVEGLFTGVRFRTLIQMPNGILVGGVDVSSSELIVYRPKLTWQPSGLFQ